MTAGYSVRSTLVRIRPRNTWHERRNAATLVCLCPCDSTPAGWRTSPDEWNPATGALDVCVRDEASVEAVALTPAPTYPTATVERVW